MNKAIGLLAGLALLVSSAAGQADTVIPFEDPLHGACPGCTAQNIGGNDVTLLGPGGVTGFGFTSSPAGNTGALQLEFLIPNSFSLAAVQLFAGLVTVTGTSSSALTLFSTTAWTSGDLTGYLGIAAAPPNPLDAWLGATQTVQPTATGYYVLFADMGQYTLEGQSDPLTNLFSLDPAVFANGGFITAFLLDAINKNGDEIGNVSTAQSSALFYNGVSSGPFCTEPNGCDPSSTPIPGAVWLFGGGLGLVAMLSGRRKRKQKSVWETTTNA